MTDLDPGDHSVSELEAELANVGSVEALESLLVAEQEGQDRKTAKQAIEDRIEAVAGGSATGADAGATAEADGGATAEATEEAAADEGGDGGVDVGGAVENLQASAGSAVSRLVAFSTALDRLFGDDLAEPVAGTAGFAVAFGALVAAALWAVVVAAGGPLLWTALVSAGSLVAAGVVVLAAVALVDVEERWLGAGLVGVVYLVVGTGLLVGSLVFRGLLGPGAVLGFSGLLAPMAAVLGLQAATLALVYEAYSRPVLPAAELDGAAPSAASLHVANWWRVAAVGVALEALLVVGLPAWMGGSRYALSGAGLAWLFVPTAVAVAALVVYVLRKAVVLERAVAGG